MTQIYQHYLFYKHKTNILYKEKKYRKKKYIINKILYSVKKAFGDYLKIYLYIKIYNIY